MDKKKDIDTKKKGKSIKFINFIFKKIVSLISHIEFLFINKFIIQESYIEYMHLLNEVQSKITSLEIFMNKKKLEKDIISNLIIEINSYIEKLYSKCGSSDCKNILEFYFDNELPDNICDNFYNDYFIPLSSNKINCIETFKKKHNIQINEEFPYIVQLLETSQNTLIEKIDGATIIFKINNNLYIYINGYFKKDSLNIFKKINNKKKLSIEENIEYLDVPTIFKDKYLDQIPIKDFIILKNNEIIENIKNDYSEFLNYKNKSLSLLIKEFIKSNIDKQRKIILLFLLSDEESQFTAHIIFDLINDKTFLGESRNLSELIYNSFHWKIQKIFKISQTSFQNNQKHIENLSINDIPYESRIMALKADDYIKSKAMEKLKEINGSKENSIKAQQWLDGFLKIPFNIFRKESIINFFKNFQIKIEKYIDLFTLKISEFNYNDLSPKNKLIYDIIIQVIDEYHSNIYKSENSTSMFINYLKIIKFKLEIYNKSYIFNDIENVILLDINSSSSLLLKNKKIDDSNEILDDSNEKIDDSNEILDNSNEILDDSNETLDDSNETLETQKFLTVNENNINNINNCMNQLKYFKKIKNELYENNIINKNNIDIMIKKLNELEGMLNLNLIKNEPENDIKIESNKNNSKINDIFIKYVNKNLEEFTNYINEWNKFKFDKKKYMKDIDNILDKCTYGQSDAKNQMKRIIGQWMNGNAKGQCFGLCGPPGVGKTTLCKNGLAKCLFDENGESRPFAFLPLGGATNGSILEGHHYTYMGSTWGKIVDILIETKCMNPIIYIDELDKISKTEHGKEIISILTHITDQSQNKEFYDRYFASVPIDLSQILFIFSYNDRENIDRILRDRIQEITIKPLSIQEKLIISQNYIIPEVLNNVGFSNSEVIFRNEIIDKIINDYTHEAGVRKLNEILYDIIRELNLKKIEDDNLYYPVDVSDEIINEVLSNIPKNNNKMIGLVPKVGLVNGLYATTSGLGGLTIIQVMRTISEKKYSLEKLTGNQGDVMKESMNCALTLSWNIIPQSLKEDGGFGLHIHCPESATPKDGPSAGLAITTAIISRIINVPIRNDIAMTGEVDLMGKACEIGGLYSKLQGAFNAGVKKVLIPKDNEKDLDIIFKMEEKEKEEVKKNKLIKKVESFLLLENKSFKLEENRRIFRNTMEIYLVNDIFEVLKHSLVDNNILFNSDF